MNKDNKKILIGALCSTTIAMVYAPERVSAQTVSELDARISKLESESKSSGYLISASGVDLTFYGYVRADAYWDQNYDMGPNNGGFTYIPSGTPEEESHGMHAYQTRLGVKGSSGELKFNFEGDFYGGDGGSFRIRHAYGEYAGWTLGQTWSN